MADSVAKGNAGVCTTDAVRDSVSRTEGGATGVRSSPVTSTTKNLRIAYANVECNVP
jgi:hypothetical protein